MVNHAVEGTMAHSMRVRESSAYPAELWALYLVFPQAKKYTTLILLFKKWPPLKVAPATTTHTLMPTY